MVSWIRKRLALRSYRRRIGPALVKRYGRETSYSINQVRATVTYLGLNADYICYAYAEYCSCFDFNAHHTAIGQDCDWSAMRHEITGWWGSHDHCDAGSATADDHAAHGHHDAHGDHGGGVDSGGGGDD